MKTVLNSQNFELSDTSSIFLDKYLERMKNFIEKNNIEIEVYEDIQERIAEIFSAEKLGNISDKVVINIVNEIWEPDEIFSELIEETHKISEEKSGNFKEYFSNQGKQLTRNSEKWIFFGICYGIAQRYNIDPLLIRLFFIFWIFLGWMTILLYIVLIFLLPNKKNDNIIIEKATKLKDNIIIQSKKVGKRIENIEKKQLTDFKNLVIENAKNIWYKIKIQKIRDKFSSNSNKNNKELDSDIQNNDKIINENIVNKSTKTKTQINNYPLSSHSDEIKEKIVYREIKPNIFIRFFRFIISVIKNILYFIFYWARFFLAFIIFVFAIPTLIAVLFTSGLIFSDIQVGNQALFEQVDFFFKIWIVWLLFSIFFWILGIFLKLLSSKIVANIFMINWLIWILIFAFIWGLGFFKTANEFTDIYTHTQILEIDTKDIRIQDLDTLSNWEGINWLSDITFIQTDNEKIIIEVTSIINRKNKKIADGIFEKLSPVSIINNNQLNLETYKSVSFTEVVPYSFLRKDIKIYLPKDANISLWLIDGNNIDNISNLYHWDTNNSYQYIWSLRQCENTNLIYDSELSGYKCISNNEVLNNQELDILSEQIVIDEIDDIINQELKNVEIIPQ